MTTTSAAPDPHAPAKTPPRTARPVRPLAVLGLAATAIVTGLGVLAGSLRVGRAFETAVSGLPDPGALTSWGLPVSTAAATAAGTVAVGCAVVGAFLVPGSGRSLRPAGYRLVRIASWWALGWLVAVCAEAVFTVSDLLAVPPGGVGTGSLISFLRDISQGQAFLVQALLALAVAVFGRVILSRNGAAWMAVLAVAGILPPAFTGHAAGAGNHQLAVTSLAFHVVGAALWTGGLVALLLVRRASVLTEAASGYSRLALWCWVLVGASGLANAWVRLGSVGALWTSRYGLLVAGKLLALVLLGAVGALHRTRTLRLMRAGAVSAFRRLAAGEVILFAATLGLAVALSRSPTPVPTDPVDTDPATDLLGFAMPPAPTVGRLIGLVLPDPWFGTIVLVGIGLYVAGVLRLRKRDIAWSTPRTIAWLSGLVVLAVVTMSGLGRYSFVLFSAHMFQHMVLAMVVPILLVLGAPATLALRAIRPSGDPDHRGPREWLLLILHSRALRVLAHPVVAAGLFIGSLYGLYFSGLFEAAMRSHLGHLVMLTHFVLVGYLFFWVVIGVDPGPRRLPYPVRMPLHFASMAMHAFFGVALLQAGTVLGEGWYASLHRPWLTDLLADQNLAAGITWASGELPSAAVLAALFWQWIRADEREQRRLDRRARTADLAAAGSGAAAQDDLARYNAGLRRLHERDQQRDG